MSEIHAIMNLDKYGAYIRKRAAISLAEDYSEDLDEFLTIPQAVGMIKDYSIGTDEEGRYLLNEEAHSLLFEAARTRIYNCGLAKLAAKGMLECAWDDETNEMVFWRVGQTES